MHGHHTQTELDQFDSISAPKGHPRLLKAKFRAVIEFLRQNLGVSDYYHGLRALDALTPTTQRTRTLNTQYGNVSCLSRGLLHWQPAERGDLCSMQMPAAPKKLTGYHSLLIGPRRFERCPPPRNFGWAN